MCPSHQAPGLDVEHLRRLHEILNSEANVIDKLGAGCSSVDGLVGQMSVSLKWLTLKRMKQ